MKYDRQKFFVLADRLKKQYGMLHLSYKNFYLKNYQNIQKKRKKSQT